jgi:hypothetical protein
LSNHAARGNFISELFWVIERMQPFNRQDARHANKQFKQGRQEIRKISVPAFLLSLLNLGGRGDLAVWRFGGAGFSPLQCPT